MALYLALVPSTFLLAQASPSEPWVDSLLKGGPFAIVLLLIILDKIGTHGERDRLRVENTELRTEIRDLNKDLRENITPLLKQNADMNRQYVEHLEERERELRRPRQAKT
jgi:hypothetical protein